MAEKALIKETFFCHFYLFRQIQDLLSAKFQFDTDLSLVTCFLVKLSNQSSSVYLSIVCSRSGPTETILMRTPSSSSRNVR